MADPRPPPLFIADAPALDFLNSIATPVDCPVEWLASGDDLLDWLRAAELVPENFLAAIRRATTAAGLDAVAAQARALREWFRGFVHEHRGRPLRAADLKKLAPLNRILERDQEYRQIVARRREPDDEARTGLALRSMRRWDSASTLLLPIATAMAGLVTAEDFSCVKACQGNLCTLVFVDRTRGHARRWCSMAVCGNRAKQAAHRRRERGR